MAISRKGLSGLLSGSIGNVVVYEMNGKMVVRSRPSVKRKKPKGKQRQTQDLFSGVMKSMQLAKPFLGIGFSNQKGHSPFHSALSANMKQMKTEEGFGFNKLILSSGKEVLCSEIKSVIVSGKMLRVRWREKTEIEKVDAEDKAILIVLNETSKLCEFDLNCGSRSSGEAVLQLINAQPGDVLHVYLTFTDLPKLKTDGKFSITQSIWAGSVTLEP